MPATSTVPVVETSERGAIFYFAPPAECARKVERHSHIPASQPADPDGGRCTERDEFHHFISLFSPRFSLFRSIVSPSGCDVSDDSVDVCAVVGNVR